MPPEKPKYESKKKITKVTATVVYQSILSGGGFANVNSVCAAFGKKPLSHQTYLRYKEYIGDLIEHKYTQVQEKVM